MTSIPVIRVGEARELLAYIPFQLGFEPRESLVAVSVRARNSRVGLVARVDLAALAEREDGAETARFVAERLGADRAARVVLVVYTARGGAAVREPESAAHQAVATMRAALADYPPDDVWVVGDSGYAALGCEDETCCPAGGRPLTDLQGTVVGAHLVFAGRRVARDRSALRVDGRASPRERGEARGAASAERARGRAAAARERAGTQGAVLAWADGLLRLWVEECARAERGERPSPTALGRLLAALEEPTARDALLLALTAPAPPADGAPTCAAVLAEVDRLGVDRPRERKAGAARAVLEAVVAHADRRAAAPALAALACVEWWCGDGARAGVLVEQCLERDPVHRLGRMLRDVVEQGFPPAWATAQALGEDADDAPDGLGSSGGGCGVGCGGWPEEGECPWGEPGCPLEQDPEPW